MPYLIACPNCSAKLKSAQQVPAGRALNCPQCKTAFRLTEPAPEIDDGTVSKEVPRPATAEPPKAPATPPPPPARSNRSVSSAPEDLSPRKGRKPQEEDISEAEFVDAADFATESKPKRSRDDDDRPRSRRRDEQDDDRPRVKRRDDEEDDRPRSKRRNEEDDRLRSRGRDEEDRPAKSNRRNDDDRPSPKRPTDDFTLDDDDKPKSRRSRDDDGEDDRPKARKARSEEYEDSEDDAPRSRSRSKKGKRTLLIALLAGGAGLLLILFLVSFFSIDPFRLFGGGTPSEMLAWAPADTETILIMDVVKIRKLDDFKDGFGGNADSARHGIRADEASTVMVASRAGMGGQDVVVYKLIASADQSKIIAAVGGKEVTVNGKKYYRTGTNGGLYFPSSRLVVVAQSENTLQTLLQKSESSAIVSEEICLAVKRGSGLFVMASVGKTAEVSDFIGSGGRLGARSATPRSFVYSLNVSGDRGTGTMVSTYDTSETARRISDELRKTMEQNPTMRGEIDSYDVSYSGTSVTLTLRGPVKGKKTFMPFGMR